MKYPNVTLELNINLDKWAALEFLKENKDSYVDAFYIENEEKIKRSLSKAQQDWDIIRGDYFLEVNNLFGISSLTSDKYTGYLSIFNFNPRFLDTKTFQFYYKHPEGTNYCIAHESMHFMFYDYIKKFGFTDEDKVWELSEIFNVIVLALPQFEELTKNPDPEPHNEHRNMIGKFKKLHEEASDLDSFITRSFDLLQE
ncbi:MAG: hypothetical protein WC243_04255 [Patescibacteria group bacterium]|jgi:hypothetical protein